MAHQINKLSAIKIKSLKQKGMYSDGAGLYLQVAPSGAQSWLFCYRLNGRDREMGLGSAVSVTLSDARQKRDDCRKLLASKIDPIENRKEIEARSRYAAANNLTFQEFALSYIEAQKSGWKNAKHIQQWTNTLETYAYPIIGRMSVQDIDINAVSKILEPIWQKKTETADRVRSRIEKILDAAKTRKLRVGDNPASWRGNLDSLFSPRSKIQRVKHHPAMPYARIGDFMKLLEVQPGMDALALRFTILNATRTNETLAALWEEIDVKNRLWIMPAERMKVGREHRIPLTEEAVDVLKKAYLLANNLEDTTAYIWPSRGCVFPGRKKGRPLSGMTMLMLLRRLNHMDITVHGFRSTFRNWVAEQTAYPRDVAEAALAHAVDNKVEAAYFRSDLFNKRQKLMADWAMFCKTPSITDTIDSMVLLHSKLS